LIDLIHTAEEKRRGNSYMHTTVRPWSTLDLDCFALSLLYGHGKTWMSMGDAKIQPLKGKCSVKILNILQNT